MVYMWVHYLSISTFDSVPKIEAKRNFRHAAECWHEVTSENPAIMDCAQEARNAGVTGSEAPEVRQKIASGAASF